MAKTGRPQKPINWEEVDKLCALQCTEEEVAQFFQCSVDTIARACLRDHDCSFAEYFSQKRGLGKISLRRAQWMAATADKNPTMLIWMGKQHLGQKDLSKHEISGPDGKPIETRQLSELTDEQLEAKHRELLEKALKPIDSEPESGAW